MLDKNGFSLMLLLLTEATIEAANISTDQHYPFHTNNNHNPVNFDSHNKTS